MKKIVGINIDRPPQGNVETFIENLSRETDNVSTLYPNCELISLGDFDINYNNENNINTRHLKWLEHNHGLKQQITSVTRFWFKTKVDSEEITPRSRNGHVALSILGVWTH